MTYHDTAGKEQKGGSIKIYGGTTFYFTAEKTVHGTWNSGDLGGQVGAQWKTLVVSTGSGNQDVGYGDFMRNQVLRFHFRFNGWIFPGLRSSKKMQKAV